MSSNLIDRTTFAGVSPSPVKAADSESVIRRFESYYPCQNSSEGLPSDSEGFFLTENRSETPVPEGTITLAWQGRFFRPFLCFLICLLGLNYVLSD